MRRLPLVVVLLASCAGCNRFAGPIAVRHMDRPDARAPDGGRYTIAEQERRGRERLAITEDDPAVGPAAFIDRFSPIGR